MRKLFFLFAFAGLAVVVFHSCRKDTLQTPTDEKQHVYTAEELNISQATLDRLRKNGDIRSKRILGGIFFSLTEIASFLDA